MLRWTLWDNHKLTGSIAPLRYLMKFVPEEKSDQHVIAWLGKRAGNALKVLDRRLFTQEWLAADHITTADLSCVGYLYYDHEFGHDLTAYPNIERWRQAIAALPGWKHPYDLMPGHPIPAGASHMTDAYIYDAIRTPRGKGRPDGSLHEVTALRLSADTLNALQARTGLPANAVEDVIWGNVTQVGEQGGCLARSAVLASDHRREGPRPLDQPLLRLRPRGGEPRRQPGPRRRRRGLHRRRRRDDEPRAHGLRRRRHRRRPLAGAEDLLRAAGHRRRHHRHRVRLLPRRRRRLRRREPAAAPPPPGRRTASPSPSSRSRDINGLPILDRDEHMRPEHRHAVARRAQALVQGHGRDDARLRRRGDPEVPPPRADQPRPPRRQLLRHRRRRRRRADRLPSDFGEQARPEAPRPHQAPPPRSAPTRRSC